MGIRHVVLCSPSEIISSNSPFFKAVHVTDSPFSSAYQSYFCWDFTLYKSLYTLLDYLGPWGPCSCLKSLTIHRVLQQIAYWIWHLRTWWSGYFHFYFCVSFPDFSLATHFVFSPSHLPSSSTCVSFSVIKPKGNVFPQDTSLISVKLK